MDPLSLLGLGSQGLSMLLGELFSSGDKAAARQLLDKVLGRFDSIKQPDLKNIDAEQVGPSQAGAQAADPALRQAQMSALSKLMGITAGGGLTAEDRANEKQALDRAALNERAQRSQIDQQMQARGLSDSGSALAMQLQNQQAGAERGADIGLQTAGDAQKRYLDAILKQGNVAGQMEGQDFGQRFQAGQARDMISRYNADKREKAGYYNANLPQQQYENQLQGANAYANAAQGRAKVDEQDANDTRTMWNNFGAGAREAITPRKKNWWES